MPEEKKFILFPENLNVSLGCPSLQMICYIAGNFEAGNSLNVKPRCNGTRRSTFAGNSALLPSIKRHRVLQCYRLRDFGGKQFHWYMSCDFEATNESASCWEKKLLFPPKF